VIEADLAIVGGGPAGTHVLAGLAQRAPASPFRVVVIERTETLGPGLPYGEAADPRHTLGRVPRRRRERGALLRAQAEAAMGSLAKDGVELVVMRDTQARSLARGWRIETDRGDVMAGAVVLATGHWHVNRLAHLERAVDWRWDVRRLAAIRDGDEVLVLGTSQSAVDLAVALAPRASTITLASRRGLLPSIWGPTRTLKAGLHLEALRVRTNVRLAEIFEAARLDGASCDEPAAGDGVGAFRRDLDAALHALRDERAIPWQAALWPTVPAVFDLFPRLVAEDRLALAPRWYLCLRYLEAIHVRVARRILELVDAGRLRVVALGNEVSLAEDATSVRAGEARGDRVVDARGPDPWIAASDDAFLRSVLDAGHAVPARVPFLKPPDDGAIIRDGRAYLETGGIWVDPATFLVRDDRGETSSLYALGPLAMGQYPVYLGLWAVRRAARLIVSHLRDRPRAGLA
jgi:uncharacterized NAD(P)/FAD-binding protein YdhS